jgi:hypothetical protein
MVSSTLLRSPRPGPPDHGETDRICRDGDHKFGGNGGLSLRRLSRIREVLEFQKRQDDSHSEDVWFASRLGLLPGANMCPPEKEKEFAVEAVWYDKPMGYHMLPGNSPAPNVWAIHQRRREIYEYCPEVKIILDMYLEREKCGDQRTAEDREDEEFRNLLEADAESAKKKQEEENAGAEEERKKKEEEAKQRKEKERVEAAKVKMEEAKVAERARKLLEEQRKKKVEALEGISVVKDVSKIEEEAKSHDINGWKEGTTPELDGIADGGASGLSDEQKVKKEEEPAQDIESREDERATGNDETLDDGKTSDSDHVEDKEKAESRESDGDVPEEQAKPPASAADTEKDDDDTREKDTQAEPEPEQKDDDAESSNNTPSADEGHADEKVEDPESKDKVEAPDSKP